MPKRGSKVNRGPIHQYFTRLNKDSIENPELSETTVYHELDSTHKMAEKNGDAEASKVDVTNAELRQLILDLGQQQTDTKKTVSDGFNDMREKFGELTDKVNSLEGEVEDIKTTQSEDRETMCDMKQQIEDLKLSLLHTQTYSRKYHLLIYGVEGHEISPAETIKRVRTFAKESLNQSADFANDFTIRHAHRLQKRQDDSPAPIIVAFMYWSEKETFLRGARNLKGTKMSVRTDLPRY